MVARIASPWGRPTTAIDWSRTDRRTFVLPPLGIDTPERWIAFEHLLDAPWVHFHLEAGPCELQQHGRAAGAIFPAAVERLRQLGIGEIGDPHGHTQFAAELGGEPHILVCELEGEARWVV